MTIQGTNITMTRGDSESLTVILKDSGFVTGDTVTLTLRREIDGDIAMQKTVTEFDDGEAVIIISPSDTEGLEFGKYWYDVQVVFSDGTVTTIVTPARFTIGKEVTY